jgi:protein phosphatase
MTKQLVAKIICPNPECQAPNPVSQNFCAHCRTTIPKIYLWAVGEDAQSLKVGQILANNRYLVVGGRVLLDTKPGWQPEIAGGASAQNETLRQHHEPRVSEDILPYLRLIGHRPHIPQVYGSIAFNRTGKRPTTLWLLEKGPIYSEGLGAAVAGKLMPELAVSWKSAASMRQLNWLWQMANLWEPMQLEGVSSTLLKPELLRVEGGLLRVLELTLDDGESVPTLADLGNLWKQWHKQARIGIAQAMDKICTQLISGEMTRVSQLIAALDEALHTAGQKQFLNCNYVTLTHAGPSREQNEDACYPPSGEKLYQNTGADLSLAIVCDGVGGHQGGEVASNLAIETIRNRIETVLSKPEKRYPDSITIEIENSTCVANDLISLRNDSENRQERQRMGTTMVMTVVYGHEAYIAHIGDSRVYRISRTGCHQMTLDDDLATREVRLGGVLYREALAMSSAGSLFQALGMNSSTALHPNIRRMLLDEECIFLLCSDGVSDRDRVEEYWQSELLPVLEGKVDLTTACQRMIIMANTQNGHDNSTVALVHCQVKQPIETGQSTMIQDLPPEASSFLVQPSTLLLGTPNHSDDVDELPSETAVDRDRKPLIIGAVVLFLLMAIGAIGWFFFPPQALKPSSIPPNPASSPNPTESPTAPASEIEPSPSSSPSSP